MEKIPGQVVQILGGVVDVGFSEEMISRYL